MSRWSSRQRRPGTRPWLPGGALRSGDAHLEEVVDVTLVLRPEARPADHPAMSRRHHVNAAAPAARVPLALDELAAAHAPRPSDVQTVAEFAAHHGLEVVEASAPRHDVIVRGSIETLDRAFGVEQSIYHHRGRHFRAHAGDLNLPDEIADLVQAVLGLDDVPRLRPHGGGGAGSTGISVSELARHYDFPAAVGPIPRIAALESGGYHASDLDAFFRELGTEPPVLSDVLIRDASGRLAANDPLDADLLATLAPAWGAGGSMAHVAGVARDALAAKGRLPSDPEQAKAAVRAAIGAFVATAEVTMDLQILGGLAPGAPVDVYFASLSVDGWRRALFAMVGAPYPGDEPQPLPAVLSVSWGGSESTWGGVRNLQVIHGALEAATARGITICCSSGDWGSRNESPSSGAGVGPPSPPAPTHHVNFPASSPAVLACGGTAITTEGEVAWKEAFMGARMATGGGMSGAFPRPGYQAEVSPPPPLDTWIAGDDPSFEGRWLPDVAANAAFASGVRLALGGAPFLGGGTSASTPIWAALIARISGILGKPLGAVNASIYRASRGLLPVSTGDNDVSDAAPAAYVAAPGWDPCTGLGTPSGSALLQALREEG